MKTLFILRHAKSSWKDDSLKDFDRPLNSRGRKAAELIGTLMRKEKLTPDLVLSSPAVRARETIEIVMKTARLSAELRYDQRIYEAGPLRLLEVISQIEEDKSSVLLVGHNPGLEELLQVLTGSAEHIATGTLGKIDLKASKWSKTLEDKGSLDWLVKAKELDQS
jgi:phosphohistidine phosphatase